MEGICEYTEYTVAGNRQGGGPPALGFGEGLTTPHREYEGASKSFRTESITKYKLTFGIARSEATQRVMAAKLTRLTHKIAIKLHLVAECRESNPGRPARSLLAILTEV
jgi:hypothetical protein